ncbi:MAG: T9SS type A sorting domain-containing protein [Saprospiraceae bacterium]|nr:T9SS type A sorting domain-containing protein [Saprospiraceae bacterium]
MGTCSLDMETSVVSGNPEIGYTVRFARVSSDDFAYIQLDFGDDTPLWEGTQFDTLEHTYPAGGIYKTNLSGWINNNCVSSVTQLVFTDAYSMNVENMPGGTDYVMPGDANGDREANVYDLLNIGIGHYSAGAPRPNATSEWAPQFAPAWPQSVAQTVNYKHLDCDGNGAVNALDADVILEHYVPIDTTQILSTAAAPPLWVSFPMDTIYMDTDNPQSLEITADLMLGTPVQPALGLYGLAFALRYPEFVDHNLSANYDGTSMFGINHMLWLPKDNHSRRQLDIGLTRTNGQAVNGYGRIAQLTFRSDFIIIIDVADRTDQNTIPFHIGAAGLVAVDAQGNEKLISVKQDTLWIKLTGTSSTRNLKLDKLITVYPNPTDGFAMIQSKFLDMQQIEVVNVLGQVVHTQQSDGLTARVDAHNWPKGVYTLRIRAKQGVVEKRLVVR